MTIKLRPYQASAIEAVDGAIERGCTRPAVVLPTGSGKTVVFAHHLSGWLKANPGKRAVVLAHRAELIDQAVSKIRTVAPELRTGVVKGGRNETLADVVVGSVQTLRSDLRLRQMLGVGMVVVDECHHVVADSYMTILDGLGCMRQVNPVPAVGYTATLTRGDGMALGEVWQDVVYTRGILDMIQDGYLVRPRGIRIEVESLDLAGVRKTAGDYNASAAGSAIEASLAPSVVADAYIEHAGGRQGLLFAPTVATAVLFREALTSKGVSSAIVTGATPDDERRRCLSDFMDGKIQVLCNCMVMTEGTDLPPASVAVICRPTCHAGLYVQMVGRVLRLWPGKDDALVLDVTGASQRHGLDLGIDLFGKEDRRPVDDPDDEISDETRPRRATRWHVGPTSAVEVDLFHGSASAWLQTRGGTWVLPAGERYIAILPGETVGEWDVVAMHRYNRGDSRWVVRAIPDLSYAMAHAEGDVQAHERTIALRDRSWRAKRPSYAQFELARRYGIQASPDAKSGELSGQITRHLASQRIDATLARVLAARSLAGQQL